jgi:hypothetical protein
MPSEGPIFYSVARAHSSVLMAIDSRGESHQSEPALETTEVHWQDKSVHVPPSRDHIPEGVLFTGSFELCPRKVLYFLSDRIIPA